MTSNSRQLIELARKFVAHGGSVDERVGAVILRGAFADADEQSLWLDRRDHPPAPFASVQVYDPVIMGDVDAADGFSPDRIINLTVVKPTGAQFSAFVFSSGASAYLHSPAPAPRLLSAELEPRGAFSARGLDIGTWDPDQAIEAPAAPIPIKARNFVRDYVPDREIVEDLSPWVLAREPAVESVEFTAWRAQAARRLLGGLVNSANLDAGAVWLQASGPPVFRIRADEPGIPAAWQELTACAQWVFLSGADVEVRQLIFAAELARAHRADLSLQDVLNHALEAAKATYEAHVQSASRETLKALADLRKTVIDETQQVTQRAQDLTSGLWRDVAVTAAPFVLNVLGDATKTQSPEVAAGFYFAAALFIAISFGLQWRINQTYLNSQATARQRWFDTLYGYISARERRDIAEAPIEKAVANYRETRLLVGLVYLALILVLAAFGTATWVNRPTPNFAAHAVSPVAPVKLAPATNNAAQAGAHQNLTGAPGAK